MKLSFVFLIILGSLWATEIEKSIDSNQHYFRAKKVIRMCIDPHWMPYEAIHHGKMIGVNRAFIQRIEDSLPIPIQLVPTLNWSQSLAFVKSKECDILSLVMPTPSREKYLNFTTPYLEVPSVLVTKIGNTKSRQSPLHSDNKIGVVKDYAMAEILKKNYPLTHFVDVENVHEGLHQVQEGTLYALVSTSLAIAHNFQSGEFSNLTVAVTLPEKLQLGFGVRKDDQKLLEILENRLQSIPQSQKDSIFNQWIGIKFQPKGVDFVVFRNVLFVILFVGLFFLYHYYNTRKLNQELRKRLKRQISKVREQDKIIFHQNKLAAMGEMIENIAHQWRQPLAQINSAVSVIDNKLYHANFRDIAVDTKLLEIEQMTQYMSQTIEDFSHFLDEDKTKEQFHLISIIEKSIEILKGPLESCQIEIDVDVDPYLILKGNANELQHIIMVLLNNAKDVLETQEIDAPKITITLNLIEQTKLQLYVCDNGGGVERAIEEKVFEPYFSTKGQSQGRGLGLYLSKKIIQNSFQGDIILHNTQYGACFIVSFLYHNEGE